MSKQGYSINVSVTLLLTGTELCIISCIIRAYNILVESTQSAIEITSCIQGLPRNLSVARPVLSDRYGKERENAQCFDCASATVKDRQYRHTLDKEGRIIGSSYIDSLPHHGGHCSSIEHDWQVDIIMTDKALCFI